MADERIRYLDEEQLRDAVERLWALDLGQPDPPPAKDPDVSDVDLRAAIQRALRNMPAGRMRGFLHDFLRQRFLTDGAAQRGRRARDIAGFITWLEQDLGVPLP